MLYAGRLSFRADSTDKKRSSLRMIRLKKILLYAVPAVVMLSVWSVLTAIADDMGPLADSLPAMLPAPEGKAKLKALLKAAKSARDTSCGMDAEQQACNRFLREARLQKDKDMEAEALLLLLLCYHNYNDKERFLAISKEAGRFYLDNGYEEHYWEYLFLELNILHTSNNQGKGMELIAELYDRAKSMNYAYGLALASCRLGTAYQLAKENEAAKAAFLEAWSYVKQVEDPQKRAKVVYYCGQALVLEYNRTHQYEQSLAVLREWSENIEACRAWAVENGESTFTSDISQIHCDMFRAETCALTGDFEEADKCLARVAAVVDSYPPLVKNYYLHTRRIIHLQKGEYEEALAVSAQLKDYYAEKGEVLMYHSMAADMRETLKSLGRYEEAVVLGDQIMMLSDSLYNVECLRQLNELSTIYEVDKLKAQKQRQRLIIISVSAGCLLLAVIIAIYIIYSYNLRRKNVSLYNRIREMTRAEKEAERMLGLVPGAELTRGMKLFRELTQLMCNEKLFLDPQVDRHSVAVRLGTNENYLANAIHEGAADTTFANYISDLRLAYSLELLTLNPDMTLEALAQESGFASYSPFFRAFVKKYGMSPSEYRKLFAAKSL